MTRSSARASVCVCVCKCSVKGGEPPERVAGSEEGRGYGGEATGVRTPGALMATTGCWGH